MAAACSQSLPVLVTANRIYLKQIVTGKGVRKIVTGKGAQHFLIVVCSSSVHARRFLGH
jgi:hypothetical protein